MNQHTYRLGANRSRIRDLFEYGQQRAAVVGEENVFDYSLGNPSIPAPAQVKQTIVQMLEEMDSLQVHSYTSAAGDLETRQAISRDLNARYGAQTKAESFFMTCGAAPALTAVLHALAEENGEVVAIAPYFPEYKPFAEGAGLTFRVAQPRFPDLQISISQLEQVVNPNTLAIIVNSPNNPSGVIYSRENLQELSAFLEEKSREFGHPIYILADEPYRELCYDGAEVPFLPLLYPNTVVCYSYSKSLSLPGERIGYIYVGEGCTQAEELYWSVFGAAREAGHVCAPSLWQKVIARCAQVRPDLESYDRNRRALYEGLTGMGFEVVKPQGAFYLLVKVPGGDAQAFLEQAMQQDILFVPGDDFGIPGYVRLCYCVSYDKIIRSLPRFRKLLENYHCE